MRELPIATPVREGNRFLIMQTGWEWWGTEQWVIIAWTVAVSLEQPVTACSPPEAANVVHSLLLFGDRLREADFSGGGPW